MTTLFGLFGTVLAQQTPQQAKTMQIALITIVALAAANLLLVILMAVSRKRKSE